MDRLAQARKELVEQQLIARGIRSPAVLAAMLAVPRDQFVPAALRDRAHDDRALSIDCGQTISQPYIVALMTEALQLVGGERVLEIGTGSGYAAAVLAQIAGEVFTVERHAILAEQARERLRGLDVHDVHVRTGDGTLGWPEHAPFDAISITAAGPVVPRALMEQMAVGGRLVAPVGERDAQTLVRLLRTNDDEWATEQLCEVRFVPLIGEQAW